MVFSDIIQQPQLLKALESLELVSPTDVQQQVIPHALAGKDLLVSSKTGSGKTFAFLLPAIQRMLENAAGSPTSTRLLILTPTRELARQILKNTQQLVKNTSLKVAMICGGEELKFQKALLRKSPEIVIGTPGRIAEHVLHKSTDFTALECLVLDEADRMLDMGLSDDVMNITNSCQGARQNLLFSATLETKGIMHLIHQIIPEGAERIDVELPSNHIQQFKLLSDDVKHKEKQLLALIQKGGFEKAIIFTNTKARAGQLDGFLRYHGVYVSTLHGDVTQDQRRVALDLFRQGKHRILVATDVAARGLDIPGVELVINFDMAHSGDEHMHRIGRTGRAGAEGKAISFVTKADWNLTNGIERYTGMKFEPMTIPGLLGEFKGPEKVKSSGKAAGYKKKVDGDSKKSDDKKPKQKVRERDKKNLGKRRQPSGNPHESVPNLGDGTTTFKKPTKSQLDE